MSFSYVCDQCGWKTKNIKEVKTHKCSTYQNQRKKESEEVEQFKSDKKEK